MNQNKCQPKTQSILAPRHQFEYFLQIWGIVVKKNRKSVVWPERHCGRYYTGRMEMFPYRLHCPTHCVFFDFKTNVDNFERTKILLNRTKHIF